MTTFNAVKDEMKAHPIASSWRPTIVQIVRQFTQGDFKLTGRIHSVIPPALATATQMEDYVRDYGETLSHLPEETWATSIAQWVGPHWDVIVDLWTIESGDSDLVMTLRVVENDDEFRFYLESLYVP